MNVKDFLKFVEIKTKVASMVPFFLGSVYVYWRFDMFSINMFFMMFASLLAFDMFVTGLNNYMDYKKAHKKDGYGYETHNVMHEVVNKKNIKESTILSILMVLVIIALVFGIMLFISTDWIVFLLGGASFAIGIIYSYGPLSISRTPFGEVFSGFFMGFVIMFLSIYIHVIDLKIIEIVFSKDLLGISIQWMPLISIFILSIPMMMGIANIMLANNICDMEEDIINKRYTLPIQIGKRKALTLYKLIYLISFLSVIAMAIFKILPYTALVILLVYIIVYKHVKIFEVEQNKAKTFETAVKNFIVMNVSMILYMTILVIMGKF